MSLTLILLSIAPALAVCGYIIHKDRFEKEPLGLMVLAFLFGVFSIFPAVIGSALGATLFTDNGNFINTLLYSFLVIGVSEEFAKFFFLRYILYQRKQFNEPMDGVVYAIMIGMGFATFENLLYVYEGGMTVALARMVTSIPAHAMFAVVMGYYVGLSKFDVTHQPELLRRGLIYPILLHGAYDFLLLQKIVPMLSVLAIIGLWFTVRKIPYIIRQSEEHSPFNDNRNT